jgi:hypothetical protein
MVYYGKVVIPHAQRVELTGLNARSQPNAPNGTQFASAIKCDGCPAIQGTVVFIDGVCLSHTVNTAGPGELGLPFFNFLAHDLSHFLGHRKSPDDT